jgi:Listeria/Bacterioides repeat
VTAKNGSTVVASSPMESVLVYNKQSSSWSATLADGQFVSTSKDILGFSLSLPDSTVRVGSISGNAISVIVPYSTAVTSLAPTISASTGASVSPASGVAKDFSDYANGVAYTVTASDGSTKAYTVKVTRRAALSFDAQSGSCATTEQDIDYPATTPVSLPTPTRTDYFFAGWYTAAGGAKGGGTRIKASTAVSADQALYAAWISTSASAWTTASSVLPDYDSSSQYFHLSAYGNGVFVEMECCTKVSTARISYAAAPSSTWTNAASLSGTPDSQALATVIYGDKFVALGWGGYIYYSSDGKDWTIATGLSAITSIGSGWTSLAYGNGYYYALQGDGKTAYSRDGISWTLGASLVCADTSVYWNQIAYGGGKVVAAGQVGTIYSYLPVFSSGDGRGGAWASVNSSATTKSTDDNYFLYNSLCYGDGVFVAVPMGNNVAHYSTDGLTWNTSALPDPGTTLKRWNVMYVDGIFVAYINDFYTSSTMLAYSLDGSSWTQASRTAANWDGMGYGDGKLVAFTWRSKNVGIMTP